MKKAGVDQVYTGLALATLQQWILEARIDPEDQLLAPDASDWVRADAVPELSRFFSAQGAGAERLDAGAFARAYGGGRRRNAKGDGGGGPGVDLTPFIDITFLLLIFFVVTAQFSHQSMKVDPPSAKNTKSRKQEKLVLVIRADGRLFLGKREVALATLDRTLKDEMLRTRQQSVVIKGDKNAKHGLFVKVLDKCKDANARSVFVGAVKEKR